MLVLGIPAQGNPSLSSELENMFRELGMSSQSSGGGVYESQSRGYLVGGSVTARTPTKYMTPLTIQLPDIKAGCGGIDMFFGGFQFINAEEFKRFLQAAGTAAIGYAFHMALQAVCQSCDSVLRSLRQFADTINKFGMDSCTAGRAAVNLLDDAFQNALSRRGKITDSSSTGDGFWSPVKGWLDSMSDSIENLHKKIYEYAKDRTNPRRPGISTSERLSLSGLNEDQMEMAISILGTKAPVSASSQEDEPDIAMCSDFLPILTVADLLEGGTTSKPIMVYTCRKGKFSDGTCERIGIKTLSDFKGFKRLTLDTFLRIQDKLETSTPLTEEEVAFIESIPIPILAIMKNALRIGPAVCSAAVAHLSDIAAVYYSIYTVSSYVDYYRRIVRDGRPVCDDDPGKRYAAVLDELRTQLERYSISIKTLDAIISFADALERKVEAQSSERIRNALSSVGW